MKKPIVLIVDDELAVRETLFSFLKDRFDCSFNTAEDGEDAVNFVKKNGCDLMLLDIKMPKKGGITVIREVKAINPNIKIIVISAWDSEDVATEALKLGATDYLIKPTDLNVLQEKVTVLLK